MATIHRYLYMYIYIFIYIWVLYVIKGGVAVANYSIYCKFYVF